MNIEFRQRSKEARVVCRFELFLFLNSILKFVFWLMLVPGVLLRAQGFQTNFEPVAFDRGKSPSINHGIASVDVASGGVDLNVPLGPGIGGPSLRYKPSLSGRITGEVFAVKTTFVGMDRHTTYDVSISPGFFKLNVKCTSGSGAPYVSSFVTPDGATHSVNLNKTNNIILPSGIDNDSVNSIINRFGYSGYNVSALPFDASKSMISVASDGLLVVGLFHQTDSPTIQYVCRMPPCNLPTKVLVTNGTIAYEYQYFGVVATPKDKRDGGMNSEPQFGYYQLVKMHNLFQEKIVFSYSGTYEFTAESYVGENKIGGSVRFSPVAAGPSVGTPYVESDYLLTYSGIDQVPNFKLTLGMGGIPDRDNGEGDVVTPDSYLKRIQKYDYRTNIKPFKVINLSTQETVNFSYAFAPRVVYSGAVQGYNSSTTLVLSSIKFPGGSTNFTYGSCIYVKNVGPANWIGLKWATTNTSAAQPRWVYAVSQVEDTDTLSGTSRITSYNRVVPNPDFLRSSYFHTTNFWTTVTRSDGSVEEYIFVQPLNGLTGDYNCTKAEQMQTLAHLKHQVKEKRYYKDFNQFAADSPYRIVSYDRWDLRRIGNPNGDIKSYSVPYATRSCDLDVIAGVLTTKEQSKWNAQQFAWEKGWNVVQSANSVPATEYCSLASMGIEVESFNSPLFDLSTTQTVSSDPSKWYWGRIVREVQEGKTPLTRTYDINSNQILMVRQNDQGSSNTNLDPMLTLTYGYTTGHINPDSARLNSSPTLAGSGAVGADYEFDGYGFVNRIAPIKSTNGSKWGWGITRENDALGRPLTETNENLLETTYSRDSAGRLVRISPPNLEVATVFNYDDTNHRIVTITRGAQKSQYCYNGFGELVLERRFAKNVWSHKIRSYDAGGRKSFESTWASGLGDETQWAASNLTQIYNGWSYTYNDYRFRLTDLRTPNGVITHTVYSDAALSKTVIVGYGTSAASSTTYAYDAIGRLRKVTDALGHIAVYDYDLANRPIKVTQTDANTTAVQVRTWNYNGLGWLVAMSQPESGTTSYSDFTVQGRAQTTNYNGRVVRADFDTLGRKQRLFSDDGTIYQINTYDTGGAESNANGKLRKVSDASGVSSSFDYFGLNGRISAISRTVDGFMFTQSLGYDAYGQIIRRVLPDGKIQTTNYDEERGVPTSTGFGAILSADNIVNNVEYRLDSWQPTTIAFANAATTNYVYSADQDRLSSLSQTVPGKLAKTWVYGYDGAGRLTTDGEDYYTYDALHRLKSAAVRDNAETAGVLQQFEYDGFGNRTFCLSQLVTNWGAGVVPPTVPAILPIPNSMPGIQNVDFRGTAYPELASLRQSNRLPAKDANGSETGVGVNGYDAQGNLKQINTTIGDPSTFVSMSYDALGRVSSLYSAKTNLTERYLYDDSGLRIRVFDGTTYSYNIYNEARQLVAQYRRTATGSPTWMKDILYLGKQMVAEVSSDGKTYVCLGDSMGSPRYIWDGSGSPLKQKFLPFGEQLTDPTTIGKFAKGYTGHEQTDPSGLVYMQARFYMPSYGRFTSVDPALDQNFSETQSWNLYTYVRNSPTMATDPTGMESKGDEPGKDTEELLKRQVTGLLLWQMSMNSQYGVVFCGSQSGTGEEKHALTLEEKQGEGSKANLDRRTKMAEVAFSYNGVTDFAYKPSDPGTCSQVVAGWIEESGAAKPLVPKAGGAKGIPGAEEWAKSPVPNWRFLKKSETPAPGDVAAVPNRGRPGFSAHVMMVYNTDGGKRWVMESGRNSIHPREISSYADIVYRRYIGD